MSNAFDAPLVPTAPGMPGQAVVPPWNPMAPKPQPNLNAFFRGMKQPQPGAQFLAAAQGKPHPAAHIAPQSPTQAALNPPKLDVDAYGNTVKAASDDVDATKKAWDAANAALSTYSPDMGAAPQFQAPAPDKGPTGEGIGHLLTSIIAPRVAPFAMRARQQQDAQHEKNDARNEKQAELAYQAQEAEAQRRAHMSEVELSKRTALAQSTEKAHEDAISHLSTAVDHQARNTTAQKRATAYADNIASQIDTRASNVKQRDAVIAETAKRDAQSFGIKNQQIATGIWRTNLQEFDKLKAAGIRSDTALNIAAQHTRLGLIEQKMRDDSGVLKETMHEKYGAYLAQVTAMKNQMGQIIAAAALPGASEDVKAQAEALFKKDGAADKLAAMIQSESQGAVQTPDTAMQQDLASAWDAGMAEAPPSAPSLYGSGGGGNTYINAPQYGASPATAGMPQPAPAPAGYNADGSSAGPHPAAHGGVHDFLTRYGPQQSASGAAPAAAGTTTPGASAPALPPPGGRVDPVEVNHVKQMIAAHPGDAAGVQKAIQIFTSRHPGMSPQMAAQVLGVAPAKGAAPQQSPPPSGGASGAHPPVGSHAPGSAPPQNTGPIAGLSLGAQPPKPSVAGMAFSGAPVNARPGTPSGAPPAAPPPAQQTPNQNPAQFALLTAQQANAKDGANAPPPAQQVQLLAKALVSKYKGMSQQQAAQIATNAVRQAGDPSGGSGATALILGAGNALQAAGRGIAGYYHGQVQDANARDAAGGSSAAARPW